MKHRLLYLVVLATLVSCGEPRTAESTADSSMDRTDEAVDSAQLEQAAASKSLPGSASDQRAARFVYIGRPKLTARVEEGIRLADSICALPAFWDNIRNYPNQKIDNSKFTMRMLADTLQAFDRTTNVDYIGPTVWANAKTSAQRIGLAHSSIFKQDEYSLAVTLIHEWVHAVDWSLHPRARQFEHIDNSGGCLNSNTASYRVERIVEKMLGRPDFAKDCPQ